MTEPRPSSTVVLARDSDDGPQVMLVLRRAGDAFGDSYTFPGGVLDADEAAARQFCSGLTAEQADGLLNTENALDYYSAVVRELFEETGVLLGATAPVGDEARSQLHDGLVSWPVLLEQQGIRILCDELHYFAHWITPTALPKRWTTRFFLARMPEGQSATPDGSEITDCRWLTATDALSGDWNLPFPTRSTIRSLSSLDSVNSLLDWAHERQRSGIPAIQPEIRAEDGRRRIFMPDIAE